MKPIRYIMKCGCEVEWEGTHRSRQDRTSTIRCNEHKEKLVTRVRECMDCGEDYHLSHHGPGGLRCKQCAKKEIARKRRIRSKNYKPKSKPRQRKPWSFDKRGDYCRTQPLCRKNKIMDCKECDHFRVIFKNHDPRDMEQFTVR